MSDGAPAPGTNPGTNPDRATGRGPALCRKGRNRPQRTQRTPY